MAKQFSWTTLLALAAAAALGIQMSRGDSRVLEPKPAAPASPPEVSGIETLWTLIADHRNRGDRTPCRPSDPPASSAEALATRCGDALDLESDPVQVIVVTLPDPIDSYLAFQFDPAVEALQRAMAAAGYVLDRQWLPDLAGGGSSRAHESWPGVILFRSVAASASTRPKLLAMLLVFETPTSGIHPVALNTALLQAAAARRPDPVSPGGAPARALPAVRVLGPWFSGSTDSLMRAIDVMRDVDDVSSFWIVSGTASRAANKDLLEGAGRAANKPVTFHATVVSDEALWRVLSDPLSFPRLSPRPVQAAKLSETTTSFAAPSFGSPESKAPSTVIPQFSFPLFISRVRRSAESAGSAANGQRSPATRFSPRLEEERPASDQLPSVSPGMTAPVVELALTNTLGTISRERFGAIQLTATDTRDKLYLLTEIARHAPDVQVFTTEAELLLAHPSYWQSVRGLIVASPYPLYGGNQRWSATEQNTLRQQFTSSAVQGLYNAALVLTNYHPDGTPASAEFPRLVEYSAPGPAREGRRAMYPAIWVSVVGRGALWPLFVSDVSEAESRYLFPYNPGDTSAGAARMSIVLPRWLVIAQWVLLPVLLLHAAAYACGCFWILAPDGVPRRTPLSFDGWPLFSRVSGYVDTTAPDRNRHRRGYLLAVFGALTGVSAVLGLAFALQWRDSLGVAGAALALLLFCALPLAPCLHICFRADWRRMSLAWSAPGVILASLAISTALAVYLGEQVLRPSRVGGALYLERLAHPLSGVSPTIPALCLALAFYIWGLVHLRRPGMPRPSRIEEQLRRIETYLSVSGHAAQCRRQVERFQRVGPAIAVLTAVVLLLRVFSPEGRAFDLAYVLAYAMMVGLLVKAVLSLWLLWRFLEQFLMHLEEAPNNRLLTVYERLPRHWTATGMMTRVPVLADLRPLVERWGRVDESNRTRGIDAIFRRDLEDVRVSSWTESRTFHEVSKDTARIWEGVIDAWRRGSDARSATRNPQELAAEEFAAFDLLLSIRDVLGRMTNSLVFTVAGGLLLLASHSLFVVVPNRLFATISGLLLVATAVVAVQVLSQIQRNGVLSVITQTTAGRLDADATYVVRIVLYFLVPLVSILAAQFPEMGGALLEWLRPLEQTLP